MMNWYMTLSDCLILSGILFSIGVFGVLTRKNAIAVLMSIELMLNSANINLVAFSKFVEPAPAVNGQVFALFSIVIAAAEVAVALSIVISIYKVTRTIDLDKEDTLKG